MNRKGFVELIVLVGVLILLGVIGVGYYSGLLKLDGTDSRVKTSLPSQEVKIKQTDLIAGWNTYEHPSGLLSFQYPSDFKAETSKTHGDKEVEIEVSPKDRGLQDKPGRITIIRRMGDGYNRPLDRYLWENEIKQYRGSVMDFKYFVENKEKLSSSNLSDAIKISSLTVGGYEAIRLTEFSPNYDDQVYVKVGDGEFYEIFLWRSRENTPSEIFDNFNKILTTIKFKPSPIFGADNTMKIVNGDIVTVKNGKEVKITNWGYNFSPALSPDKSKIAYLSETKESLESQKVDKGYDIKYSTNIWVINTDGGNPVKVTDHKDLISRRNLHWIDNNRLLYTDGKDTVRVYSLDTKSYQTIFGPEDPVAACVDVCEGVGGFLNDINDTNDPYLVHISYFPAIITSVNLKTLKVSKITDPYITVCMGRVELTNNGKMLFTSAREVGQGESVCQPKVKVTIDLATSKASYD